jgi:hypothetical protein
MQLGEGAEVLHPFIWSRVYGMKLFRDESDKGITGVHQF